MIKEVIDYWNNQPCNIKHSNAAIGTREYFYEVEHRKYLIEPHIIEFADFSNWRKKDVLELGCGIGTDGVNFARANAYYTGVDVSNRSIRLVRARFELFNLVGVISCVDIENLPSFITKIRYDLVYSFGVIHHTPNPQAVVDQVVKLLNPVGEFRLMLYSKYSIKNLLIKLSLSQHEAQSGCPIARTYSFKEIRELLSAFEIVSIKKAHIFKYRLKEYKNYEYKELAIYKWMPQWFFDKLESWFGWHTLIVCKLK